MNKVWIKLNLLIFILIFLVVLKMIMIFKVIYMECGLIWPMLKEIFKFHNNMKRNK